MGKNRIARTNCHHRKPPRRVNASHLGHESCIAILISFINFTSPKSREDLYTAVESPLEESRKITVAINKSPVVPTIKPNICGTRQDSNSSSATFTASSSRTGIPYIPNGKEYAQNAPSLSAAYRNDSEEDHDRGKRQVCHSARAQKTSDHSGNIRVLHKECHGRTAQTDCINDKNESSRP